MSTSLWFWLLTRVLLAVWKDKPAEYGPLFHSGGKSGPYINNRVSYVCAHHSSSTGEQWPASLMVGVFSQPVYMVPMTHCML